MWAQFIAPTSIFKFIQGFDLSLPILKPCWLLSFQRPLLKSNCIKYPNTLKLITFPTKKLKMVKKYLIIFIKEQK
jgi:hypothetical protein